MRFYKTTYFDDAADPGRNERAVWDGTQAESATTRKKLKAEGMRNVETAETDVPTDKKGLLQFLNQWCAVH